MAMKEQDLWVEQAAKENTDIYTDELHNLDVIIRRHAQKLRQLYAEQQQTRYLGPEIPQTAMRLRGGAGSESPEPERGAPRRRIKVDLMRALKK